MAGDSAISGLCYVVVQTSKIDEWRRFAEGLLGLMPSNLPLPEGSYAFRMDNRMARVILQPGDDAVAAFGWEVRGRREWDALQDRFDRAGVATTHVTGPEALQRGVTEVLRLEDPAGMVVELALMPLDDPIDRFVSPLGVHFVTGDQGMGHLTAMVANFADSVDFYVETLGFHQREIIDKAVRASFSGPNPRHHSIALVDGHGENNVHHIMFEVDSIDDVGRCLDRVMQGEAQLTVGLGRHFNDKMTSFYMASPSGLQVEYGFAGLRVDDDEWVEGAQGGVGGASLWGHHPVEHANPEAIEAGFRREA